MYVCMCVCVCVCVCVCDRGKERESRGTAQNMMALGEDLDPNNVTVD